MVKWMNLIMNWKSLRDLPGDQATGKSSQGCFEETGLTVHVLILFSYYSLANFH